MSVPPRTKHTVDHPTLHVASRRPCGYTTLTRQAQAALQSPVHMNHRTRDVLYCTVCCEFSVPSINLTILRLTILHPTISCSATINHRTSNHRLFHHHTSDNLTANHPTANHPTIQPLFIQLLANIRSIKYQIIPRVKISHV